MQVQKTITFASQWPCWATQRSWCDCFLLPRSIVRYVSLTPAAPQYLTEKVASRIERGWRHNDSSMFVTVIFHIPGWIWMKSASNFVPKAVLFCRRTEERTADRIFVFETEENAHGLARRYEEREIRWSSANLLSSQNPHLPYPYALKKARKVQKFGWTINSLG